MKKSVLFSGFWVLVTLGIAWILYRYWVENKDAIPSGNVTVRAETPILISRVSSETL